MKIFGIEFAPLFVPWRRRRQTLIVALYFYFIILTNVILPPVWIYMALFTRYYWICFLYLVWMIYDSNTAQTGSRKKDWLRKMNFWKDIAEYFPIKLFRYPDSNFDPSKNYLFVSYPHGIWCTGISTSMMTNACGWSEKFPGLKSYIISLTLLFRTPIYREFILSLGLLDSSEQCINETFSQDEKGYAIGLIVGGAAEVLNSHPNTYRIILKSRKGFIRIALKNGVSLVPVISFGEVDIYHTFHNPQGSLLRSFQEGFRKIFGLSPMIAFGRGIFQYTFGLLPHRRPISVFVGHPIDVAQINHPTLEQIDELHALFTEKLIELFEKEKYNFLKNAHEVNLIIE